MGVFIDLIGNKYGRLTVVSRAENSSTGMLRWNCLCECGNETIAQGGGLKNGHTRSCGCLMKEIASDLCKSRKKAWQPVLCENYYKIPLNNGEYALVDIEDFDKIKEFTWYKANTGYAMSHIPNIDKGILLHRFIMPIYDKCLRMDHISMNKLDNRKANLRIVPFSVNVVNTNIHVDNTSGYRGVCFDKGTNRWRTGIRRNGHKINIGRFDTPEAAAKVYNDYCRKFDGKYARLNFPNEGEFSCRI